MYVRVPILDFFSKLIFFKETYDELKSCNVQVEVRKVLV